MELFWNPGTNIESISSVPASFCSVWLCPWGLVPQSLASCWLWSATQVTICHVLSVSNCIRFFCSSCRVYFPVSIQVVIFTLPVSQWLLSRCSQHLVVFNLGGGLFLLNHLILFSSVSSLVAPVYAPLNSVLLQVIVCQTLEILSWRSKVTGIQGSAIFLHHSK